MPVASLPAKPDVSESKARSGWGNPWPEWAIRIRTRGSSEAGSGGFDVNGFFLVGADAEDAVDGVLRGVQEGLADLMRVAEDGGHVLLNGEPEFDGVAEEVGAVHLLDIHDEVGDGEGVEAFGGELGEAGEAFQNAFHATGFD